MIPDADRINNCKEDQKIATMDFPALEQQLLSIRKYFPPPPTA